MDIIHFFENVESVQESEIVSVSGTNYLQLEVMGDASEFKIQVSAQIIDGGEFFPLSILKNNTFTIHNFITENGFYRIDTTGILNIQLKKEVLLLMTKLMLIVILIEMRWMKKAFLIPQ